MLKLSFIVPFYNVEQYIGACLDSLYAQDIPEDEYEVLCIDDCSPDNSRSIVLEYQKLHKNLRLIAHENNQGLGAARNTGVVNAIGKYLWFIDSDDFIAENKLHALLAECLNSDLDVLCFNYQKVEDSNTVIERAFAFPKIESIANGIGFVEQVFGRSFVYHLGYVVRCLYRADYLKGRGLVFPEKVFWEDTVFFPKSILFAERIKSIEDILYCYRVNPESISGNKNKYKADRIYQFAFCAGYDLYCFADEFKVMDGAIASDLLQKSHWYFNSFSKPLALSTIREKQRFFNLVKQNRRQIKEITPFLSFKNKLLIKPVLGFALAVLMKPLYLFKQKLKK